LYYNEFVTGNRFAAGTLNGTYTEVGVGWGNTTLFSRALIVDGSGNPTSITVLSDEVLDVYYRLRKYPPLVDVTGTRVISSVSYDYTLRARSVTDTGGSAFWGRMVDTAVGATTRISAVSAYLLATGNIGAITGTVSGTSSGAASAANQTYSNNSLTRGVIVTYGLTNGNVSGGARSATFVSNLEAAFQCEFDPVIPKDNTKTLTLNWSVSWGRRP
jgi:hypothetical protein